MNDASEYPPALPHGKIQEIFPDVFMLQGSIRGGPVRFNRNMVIVRYNDALTLINPVRLHPEEESNLQSLGRVRHVLRLGSIHGRDDAYYVKTFSAEFWCLPGSNTIYAEPEASLNHALGADTPLPMDDAELFVFSGTRLPEAALLIKRHGGILVTCDSLQSWQDWNQCNVVARLIMPLLGFELRTLIGRPWLKAMTGKGSSLESEFNRLMQWNFEHLIGAHGGLCHGSAHAEVEQAVHRAFRK